MRTRKPTKCDPIEYTDDITKESRASKLKHISLCSKVWSDQVSLATNILLDFERRLNNFGLAVEVWLGVIWEGCDQYPLSEFRYIFGFGCIAPDRWGLVVKKETKRVGVDLDDTEFVYTDPYSIMDALPAVRVYASKHIDALLDCVYETLTAELWWDES